MRSNFNKLSKPEVDFLTDNCLFSKEEGIILNMASSGNSNIQIAEKLNLSVSSVEKKKRKVRNKALEFLEVDSIITTVYVNGKRVTDEELEKMEIRIDKVKEMLSKKLIGDKEGEVK